MAGNRHEQLRHIFEKAARKPKALVETGTYRGKSTAIFAEYFDEVYTIELNPRFHKGAKAKLAEFPNVECFLGNSADVLQMLTTVVLQPAVFFLDAHNIKRTGAVEGGFPIWRELELLKGREYPDIIVVDDVHTFERSRPGITLEGANDWEAVSGTTLCDAIGPERIKEAYIFDDIFVMDLLV